MCENNGQRDIYDYFDLIDDAKTKKERDTYIEEALLLEPDNLELLLLKNEKNKKKPEKYLAELEKIVAVGNKQMQDGGYFRDNKGEFWLVYETRPYMRACYEYLITLMKCGFVTRAIKEGERLLELCKNDNLGVRYDLMHLFALKEDKENAEKLFEDFKREQSPQMTLPLCFLYYKIGETENAEKFLFGIYEQNKDLLKFIKKVISENIYAEIGKMSPFGYRPCTMEELLEEYVKYYSVLDTCPLFFGWAKSRLEEEKSKNK